jgi:Na+-transporting methylmalonyl-CoA/oxaloacetate decarboxylase gamma subunit
MKAMPSDVQTTIDQMNKITKMLEPLNSEVLDQARRSSTVALYSMLKAATDAAKDEDKDGGRLRSICIDFISSSNYTLKLFWHTKSQFSLVMMPTADFVIRTLAAVTTNSKISKEEEEEEEETPKFLQVLLKLHALKYILAGVYIRHSITALSNDMLISVVPIMSFIAALSSLNDFSNISMIRILFATGLAVVFLPFILLVVRVIPIVHLMRSNSHLPFPYN